jgi:hypothetical protein
MIKKETLETHIYTILIMSIFIISLSGKMNSYFIYFFIFLNLLSIFFLYLFLRTHKSFIPDFQKLISIKEYIAAMSALTFLYTINIKDFIYIPYSCKYLIQYFNCKYYIFIFIFSFILFFFFFLQIRFTDIRKVFIKFGLICFFISLLNLIIFYLKDLNILNIPFIIGFDGDYNFYWQFLPFAFQGLRNFEVIPFILAYISAISLFKSKDKNYLKYIYLFFISIFLTFSKNAWVATIVITFITLSWEKKNLHIIKNCVFGTLIVVLLIFTFQKLVIKKFHTNILSYSIYKMLPANSYKKNLFSNEYYDDFKKMFGGTGSFENPEVYIDYLFDSTEPRFLIYTKTIEEIFKNPLLGQGLNAHIEIKNINGKSNYTDNYESQILTIFIETGFLGFFIYLYIFIFSFVKIKQNKEFYITLLIGILILSVFNSYQRNILIYFLLAFIFANIIKTSEIESFNNKSKK